MANNIGRLFISTADVKFLDPTTKKEVGQAIALTESAFNSEIQEILVRGGYLNPILFDVKHSRELTVSMVSATFKPEFLAFQTGTSIQTVLKEIYIFNECQTATNGAITLNQIPVSGMVHIELPNGTTTDVAFTPSSKDINVGAGVNGQCLCSYFFGRANTENIVVDTTKEPMTVTAIMNIHYKEQDGTQGKYQITVPYLKFNGAIDFSFTADGVSTTNLGGRALQYVGECGQSRYADLSCIPDEETAVIPQAIKAIPDKVALAVAGTSTANILAVMPELYANVNLTNGGTLTFASDTVGIATVGATTGLITGVSAGDAIITATYTPAVGITFTDDIAVTVTV